MAPEQQAELCFALGSGSIGDDLGFSQIQPFITDENTTRKEIRAQVFCWNGATASLKNQVMQTGSPQRDGARKPKMSLVVLRVTASQMVH